MTPAPGYRLFFERSALTIAALAAVLSLPASWGKERGNSSAEDSPVHVSLSVAPDETGSRAQLTLGLKIDPSWYIYVKSSRSQVLQVDLELPAGVTAEGEWTRPKPRVLYQDERVEVYVGEQTLTRTLKLDAAAAGELTIAATVHYQACDPVICRPPEKVRVTAKLERRGSRR